MEYVVYQEELHLNDVIELEKVLWPNYNEKKLKDIFSWKYGNIHDCTKGFVAIDNEKVVGFRGLFIQKYHYNGKNFNVAVLGDAVVNPTYQGKGIFSKLTSLSIETCKNEGIKYILGLSSNSKSSPGYIKLGWKPFLKKKYLFGFSLMNVFRRYREKIMLNQKYKLEIHDYNTAKIYFKDFENIWNQIKINELITLRRDEYYWNWRFKHPDWNPRFAILFENNTVVGVLVYILEKRRGIQVAKILDFLCRNDVQNILIKGFIRFSGVLFFVVLPSSNKHINSVFKKFFRLKKISNHHDYSDYYLINILSNDNESSAWDITYSSID